MAKYVREIMSPDLYCLTPDTPAKVAQVDILRLGITGAPVVDESGVPLGLVSLRDLVDSAESIDVAEIMTVPAVVIADSRTIEEAARTLGRLSLHRLVVVDETGRAVGVVSALDVIRGLIGMAPTHPESFRHYDSDAGVVWTEEADLTIESIMEHAPDTPGVFLLIRDTPGQPETVLWAEAAENVTSRLMDLVATEQPAALSRILAYDNLRFRAAPISDGEKRRELYERVKATVASWPRA